MLQCAGRLAAQQTKLFAPHLPCANWAQELELTSDDAVADANGALTLFTDLVAFPLA